MNDDCTAFPSFKKDGAIQDDSGYLHTKTVPTQGMSLRDYFAAKALQGTIANSGGRYSAEDVAKSSYDVADAMIAERSKPSVTK